MNNFKIHVKHVYQENYKGIMCFLADDQYCDDDIRNETHRTKSLCWIGFPDKLMKMINRYQNVNLIISAEIVRFKRDFEERMLDLLLVGTPMQIKEMEEEIENFIYITITDLTDQWPLQPQQFPDTN